MYACCMPQFPFCGTDFTTYWVLVHLRWWQLPRSSGWRQLPPRDGSAGKQALERQKATSRDPPGAGLSVQTPISKIGWQNEWQVGQMLSQVLCGGRIRRGHSCLKGQGFVQNAALLHHGVGRNLGAFRRSGSALGLGVLHLTTGGSLIAQRLHHIVPASRIGWQGVVP